MGETIRGTSRADVLEGSGDDTILAGEGWDTLRSATGADELRGEGGDDRFELSGDASALVYGGEGWDTLIDESASDTFFDGGAGEDAYVTVGHVSGVTAIDEDDPLAGGVVATIADYRPQGTVRHHVTLMGVEGVHGYDEFGDTHDGVGPVLVDLVLGGAGDDALAGDDFVRAFLHGGAGNDYLEGRHADGRRWSGDTLAGGAGDDTLVAYGPGELSGGDGEDVIELLASAAEVSGGAGADAIFLAEGADVTLTEGSVSALDGDVITGFGRRTLLSFFNDAAEAVLTQQRSGADTVLSIDMEGDGTVEAVLTLAGLAEDAQLALRRLSPLPGGIWDLADVTPAELLGTDGFDDLVGFAGDDTLRGGHGDDVLNGGSGDDLIEGGDGADRIERAYGDDTVYAGAGDDTISVGLGDDLVFAGAGDDRVVLFTPGARSFSRVQGEAGTDTLELGALAGWDTTVTAEEDGLTVATSYPVPGEFGGGVRLEGFERLEFGWFSGPPDDDQPVRLTLAGDLGAYLEDVTTMVHEHRTGLSLDAGAVTGGAAFDVTGGDLADTLIGGDGDDVLFGGAGGDLLVGDGGVG